MAALVFKFFFLPIIRNKYSLSFKGIKDDGAATW